MDSKSASPFPGSEIFFHSPTPFAREAFLYPLCLGHYLCGEDYEVDRKRFDSYLLMYIVKGEGYVVTPQEAYSFQAHQAILIDCRKPHRYGALGSLEFYWMHFDGLCGEKYMEYLQSANHFPLELNMGTRQEVQRMFASLLRQFTSEGFTEIQLGKYLTDLLTLLAVPQMISPPLSPEAFSDCLSSAAGACAKAAAYMRRNFTRPISAEETAAVVSLSPCYFIRRFKEQYGLTPHQYLMNLRLDSARFYLSTTGKTVKEIGFACGFQSENSFCIAFKKQVGVTPTSYRNSVTIRGCK